MNYYNPLDEACKSVIGAIARTESVTLKIFKKQGGEGDFSAKTCALLIHEDGQAETRLAMTQTDDGFVIALRFWKTGLYFYRFELDGVSFGCGKMRRGTLSCTQDWQITVFSEDYTTPEWIKGGVMYQIFPDRFCKVGEIGVPEYKILRSDWGGTPRFRPNEYGKVQNNDFFGGNLNGIREKLPYLKELGVSVIYLNPIFEAYSNHRYDTGDYMKIDPLLGTVEDFDRLVAEAESCGIRLILDGVFNHTGDDSRYFNKYGRYNDVGAYQSKNSPYADWYTFREFPTSYDSWWGIEVLPAINEASESYQNFIFGEDGVIKTWLRHGIGGYRLDVADEMPDAFLQKLRKSAKELNPDAVIIGEVWEDASNKISYDVRRRYFQGAELDSVMNYPVKDAIINYMLTGNTTALRETVAQLIDNYPKQALDCLMNILGTHDTARILTVLGEKHADSREMMAVTTMNTDERQCAKQRLKMAALLQFTLPGVPCIYYGDENGAEGYHDPFCRRCYDWAHPDNELRAYYRALGKLRRETFPNVFRDGEYREVYADSGCLIYERRSKKNSVYVCVNNSGRKYRLTLDGEFTEYLSGVKVSGELELEEFSSAILAKIK